MSTLVAVLGGLAFFVLIIASVLLHELGHFVPAKLFGIKVTQFMVGFGPTLWSTRRGETEYGVKLFPFGGYCRLVGMYPPRREGAKNTWLQRVADSAREAEREEIGDVPADRLFYTHPTWQKLIVMAGGILTNLLLAFLLFWGVLGTVGTTAPTTTVASVSDCLIPATRADQTCQPGDPESPSAQAGLRPGDRLVSMNGTPITSATQAQSLIRANRDGALTLVVNRDGHDVTLPTVHTVIQALPSTTDPSSTVQAGFLGYSPQLAPVKYGPVGTLGYMGQLSQQSVVALVELPVKTYNVVAAMVEGKPRDANSPMSIVGASRVAGDVAADNQIPTSGKLAVGASLLGSLNLFLFWLNVVPLPPMDGGHIAGAVYEWLRRRLAALRGRPDPQFYADVAKLLPVAYLVGGALVVMGVVLVIADIVSPVRIL